MHDTIAEFFVSSALASSWIYAAVFYTYWRMEDDRTIRRRTRLLEILVAFCLAIFATLLLRPWVGWPAPTLVPRFQQLSARSLWNGGKPNCFPSHSTLTYLLVATGFWSFRRWPVGIPAHFAAAHLCRGTLPSRRYCSHSFRRCGGVGGTPDLRAAPGGGAADTDRVKGTSG